MRPVPGACMHAPADARMRASDHSGTFLPAESPDCRPGERGTQHIGASLTVIRGKRLPDKREPDS